MDNKKNKIMTMVFMVSILILVISTTYAFFAPQQGGTTSTNATVTSNTTDLLTFSINRDISFTVTQNDFQENGTNQSGDATATATLTPNNKTGSATMNYYLYLNIESNPTVYSESNTNNDPELMLQVFDGNNQLVTLTGLGTQKTINGVTGYDITGVSGLKTLLDNHAISASNNTATIENWRIVITLINLDVNQNDNTGKEISAEIIIRQDEMSLGFTGTIYRDNKASTSAGSSINPETAIQWCDIKTSTGDQYDCFVDQSECEQFLVDEGYTATDTCEPITVGIYETTASSFQIPAVMVYCGVEDLDDNCNGHYPRYDTLEECEDEIDTSIYTCIGSLYTVGKNIYLKHNVVDGIIRDSEACLYYNNHEFCLGPNYWEGTIGVQDSAAEMATKNKLQTAMENALGTSADNCLLRSDYIECIFGNPGGIHGYVCDVYYDGGVSCVNLRGGVQECDGYGYSCEVNTDGEASCNCMLW